MIPAAVAVLLVGAGLGLAFWQARRRHLNRWLVSYLLQAPKRRRRAKPVHVLLCIADHYEPKWANALPERARARVARWVRDYPRLFGGLRDSDGRPPRYTFFYPLEEYEPEYLEALAELCRDGFAEVEVHLHHDSDTPEGLRDKLLRFRDILSERHGLLGRDRATGRVRFGFIHGNWALNNARPDGRWCGVNDEISVLRAAACYADFTLPSAPSPTQTRKINSIYYARGDAGRPKGHDWGVDAGSGPAPEGALMLIQGPLVLDWGRRKWGLVPRVENGCLQETQPPDMRRLEAWLRARVQVPGRPDWFFVKLHAHGAGEAAQQVLLGESMVQFHRDLARRAEEDSQFYYHYVTAREMYNLARAAEAGWTGSVADARDYEVVWEKGLAAPRTSLQGATALG